MVNVVSFHRMSVSVEMLGGLWGALVDKDEVKGMTLHMTTVMLNEVWSERELLHLMTTALDLVANTHVNRAKCS